MRGRISGEQEESLTVSMLLRAWQGLAGEIARASSSRALGDVRGFGFEVHARVFQSIRSASASAHEEGFGGLRLTSLM